MVFVTMEYYCFLIILVMLHLVAPQRFRWLPLLTANIAFYWCAAGTACAIVLAASLAFAFAGALVLGKMSQRKKEIPNTTENAGSTGRLRFHMRIALVVVLLLVLCPLVFFKYATFFEENLRFVGIDVDIAPQVSLFGLLLPLGISFYTFQMLGYVIDVFRGTCTAQRNPAKFILFASWFPSMILGPINRYNKLFPQLVVGKRASFENIQSGVLRIFYGLLKKLVIADRLLPLVDNIFERYDTLPWYFLVLGVMAFLVQSYCDFSGCVDIAIGSSRMLGIEIEENFDAPYLSRSIAEYWRRWHITLGAWIRDYVFYPCGLLVVWAGAKTGKRFPRIVYTAFPLFVAWFLMGLWHGADWSFIIGTGVLHWAYMISGELLKPGFSKMTIRLGIETECFSWRLLQQIRTFCLVGVGSVFFRTADASRALDFLRRIARFDPGSEYINAFWIVDFGIDWADAVLLAWLVACLASISVANQYASVKKWFTAQNTYFRWTAYYLLIFSVLIFGKFGPDYNPADFIYRVF